ncbi:MAG: peptide-methionine (S)-S-oxide reductase MsrA [Kosmotogaceae bacterium]
MKYITIVLLVLFVGGFGMALKGNEIPIIDQNVPKHLDIATFGMGCFWGSEASFGAAEGVYKTRVGYSGGTKENPTYYSLGDHTETVQIEYDSSIISYKELLEVFWNNHSPYYQSYSKQYMSLILYHNDFQKETAENFIKQKEEESGKRAYSEIKPLDVFYLAEYYHQKYFLKQEWDFYRIYREIYDDEEIVDSTATARVNSYLRGKGSNDQLKEEINKLGLSEETKDKLLRYYETL